MCKKEEEKSIRAIKPGGANVCTRKVIKKIKQGSRKGL